MHSPLLDSRHQSAKSYSLVKHLLLCFALATILGVFHQTRDASRQELAVAAEQEIQVTDTNEAPIHEKIHELLEKAKNTDIEAKLREVVEGPKNKLKENLHGVIENFKGKIPSELTELLQNVMNGSTDIGDTLTEILMDGADDIQIKLQQILDDSKDKLKGELDKLLKKFGDKIPKPLKEKLDKIAKEKVDDAAQHLQDLLDKAFTDLDNLIQKAGDKIRDFFFPQRGEGQCKMNYSINCRGRSGSADCGKGCDDDKFTKDGCKEECCKAQADYCKPRRGGKWSKFKRSQNCMKDRKCPVPEDVQLA